MDLFLHGALGCSDVLAVVAGPGQAARPARLPGYHEVWPAGQLAPALGPGGDCVAGWLLSSPGPDARARIAFHERALGRVPAVAEVLGDNGERTVAEVFLAGPGPVGKAGPDGTEDRAPILAALAGDIMARYGHLPPERIALRIPQMLVRAASTVRAARPRPGTTRLRRDPVPADVAEETRGFPYEAYFAIEEDRLRFRRFNGAMSAPVDRAVFISGDAVVLLPYDPVRDRVLVIEQFRAGPHARGDGNPWLIEAIAGRIDGGETPEEAARREAFEEAALVPGRLIEGPACYPSPAAKAEYIYSYVGLCDLPDSAGEGIGGLASEAEDIRRHVIPFDMLMELCDTGEAENAPLLIIAGYLARIRPGLRTDHAAG